MNVRRIGQQRFRAVSSFAIAIAMGGAMMLQTSCTRAAAPSGPAPQWTLTDVNGKTVKLSDFAGKVVILDFWATWCPPCRMEIPGYVALQKEYGAKGLAVVGISLDQNGPAVVKKFMAEHHMNYPVVMGNEKVAKDYGGINAIPTTFVINKQGHIVAKHIGYTKQSEFEKEIKPLL